MVLLHVVPALLILILASAGSSPASAQFFVMKQTDPDFGEGRFPASQAKNLVDQNVTVCGRGSNISQAWHALNIGDPGMYGLIGADLLVFFPREASPIYYYGKLLCVTGIVKMHDLWRSTVPGIIVESPQQITVLSGVRPSKK